MLAESESLMGTISGFARIKKGEITVDGRSYFRADSEATEQFLMGAYSALSLNYPKFYKMDQLSRLGFLAAEVLISNYDLKHYTPFEIAVVLSNAHSSLDSDVRYYEASRKVASPALFVYTLPNIVAGEICIRHTIKGENAFFVTQAFDAELLFHYVKAAMSDGVTKACVAGWVDVWKEHYDVLLYLVEEDGRGLKLRHAVEEIKRLYDN